MKPSEYLDPQRFPLTTQGGLDIKGQMMIDAFNYDSVMELIDSGADLTEEQKARRAELQEKIKAQPEVRKRLATPAEDKP